MRSNEIPFETNYRLQITFNLHVHHQIVLRVAENVAQNESFVLSKVTPASKVPPFDGMDLPRVSRAKDTLTVS